MRATAQTQHRHAQRRGRARARARSSCSAERRSPLSSTSSAARVRKPSRCQAGRSALRSSRSASACAAAAGLRRCGGPGRRGSLTDAFRRRRCQRAPPAARACCKGGRLRALPGETVQAVRDGGRGVTAADQLRACSDAHPSQDVPARTRFRLPQANHPMEGTGRGRTVSVADSWPPTVPSRTHSASACEKAAPPRSACASCAPAAGGLMGAGRACAAAGGRAATCPVVGRLAARSEAGGLR